MQKFKVTNTFPGEEYGQHEYDIHVEETDNGTKYSLIRSNGGFWSEDAKGKTVVAILDDGDGIKLSKHITKTLQYDTAAELYILLSFINKSVPASSSLFMGFIERIDNQKFEI